VQYIFRIQHTDRDDTPNVGKKAVVFSELAHTGIPIADGFVISKEAFDAFLRENNLKTKIDHLLKTLDHRHPESILQVSTLIKKIIKDSVLPDKMVDEFLHAYHGLTKPLGNASVRMHAADEFEHVSSDTSDHAILTGDSNLLFRLKDIWSSHFSPDYLQSLSDFPNNFPKGKAVIIQHLVNADVSGVLYTANPLTNDKKQLVIEAVFGDYDATKTGTITPDRYEVDKNSHVLTASSHTPQTVAFRKTNTGVKEMLLSTKKGNEQKLTSIQIEYLLQIGIKIEQLFISPQEITWALKDNKFVVLDTHPIHFPVTIAQSPTISESSDSSILAKGIPVSNGLITGHTRIVSNEKDAAKIESGDIVILNTFDPKYRPYCKKAAGLIFQNGGTFSDGAVFARQLGIPSVTGIPNAQLLFRHSLVIKLDGQKGIITKPFTHSKSKTTGTAPILSSATKLYVNLSDKKQLTDSLIAKTDGIGLLPAEKFMKAFGIHPKKIINDGQKNEFITALAEEIAAFCRSYSPRSVIYRASDMTSHEYRALQGGKEYEPTEENPIMGYRGAFRFIREPEVFSLELEAIKMVRNKLNLRNLQLMIPFVRTVKELADVKKIISASGLYRSPSFKIWMMAEVPANIFLAEKYFQTGIDGIMIGSDDLAMLLLGTDHHNSEVSKEYSEGDEAVHLAIEHVIKTAKKNNVDTVIHFESPTFQEDFLEKIVRWGVTGITVPAIDLELTRAVIIKTENKLIS